MIRPIFKKNMPVKSKKNGKGYIREIKTNGSLYPILVDFYKKEIYGERYSIDGEYEDGIKNEDRDIKPCFNLKTYINKLLKKVKFWKR